MLKKAILMPLFLISLLCVVYGAGKKEKVLLIPSDAEWVFGLDIPGIMQTQMGTKILNDLIPELAKDYTGIKGANSLDNFLQTKLGISTQNVTTITGFGLSTASGPDFGGIIVELKNITPDELIDKLKQQYTLTQVAYKQTTYAQCAAKNSIAYLYPLKSRILIAPEKNGMEKMLQVLGNADDLSKNKRLFKLVNQYKKQMLYITGFIPGSYLQQNTALLEEIRDFGLSVTLNDKIGIKLTLNCSNGEYAENIATLLKLSINMSGNMSRKMNSGENKALANKIGQLVKPIKVSALAAEVFIDIVYTEQDLGTAQQLLPALTRNMNF